MTDGYIQGVRDAVIKASFDALLARADFSMWRGARWIRGDKR